MGYPTQLDGSPAHITHLVDEFIEVLKKEFKGVKIEQQDERFTSVEAKKIILKSGARKKKRRDKALVDKVSAVLILQAYMETNIY